MRFEERLETVVIGKICAYGAERLARDLAVGGPRALREFAVELCGYVDPDLETAGG